jgi:hypothetical protein
MDIKITKQEIDLMKKNILIVIANYYKDISSRTY